VIWQGAEYRGRARQVVWDGTATFEGDTIQEARPINFHNRDKTLDRAGPDKLAWRALTTGNFGGFDALLADGFSGRLRLETAVLNAEIELKAIGYEDSVFEASGELPKTLKVFRLPDEGRHRHLTFSAAWPCGRRATTRSTSASPRRTARKPGRARSTSFAEAGRMWGK
jgi:hypothetical protein